MGRLVAIGHRRPGRPMVTRYDRAFFGDAPVGRISPREDKARIIELVDQHRPALTPAPDEGVRVGKSLGDRIITGFLIFTFGMIAGYLWAAIAYGHLPL